MPDGIFVIVFALIKLPAAFVADAQFGLRIEGNLVHLITVAAGPPPGDALYQLVVENIYRDDFPYLFAPLFEHSGQGFRLPNTARKSVEDVSRFRVGLIEALVYQF